MELFLERGFEQTTVTEIASRAGLTQRTFFRHFADKREVLFGGSAALQELLLSALASAPESAAPIDAVAAALEAASAGLQERREYSRQRQAVIAANPELQERELIKLAACLRRWLTGCASAASPTRARAWLLRWESRSSGLRSNAGRTTQVSETCRSSCGSRSTCSRR